MSQDHERQTDELCRLFSTTLHSLAADAAAVRQVSSLAKLSSGVIVGDEENNENLPSVKDNKDDGALKGLRDLDLLVTGIEQKVAALREIVMEEKRALEAFETTLQEEADSQATILQQMLQAYQEVAEPKASTTNSSRAPLMTRRDSVDPRSNNDDDSSKSRNVPNTAVSFDRVTIEELKGFSRNTLGRVSRLDLNEALEEIEKVCQNKLAALPTQNKSNNGNGLMTSNALQRRYDYLKQQRATVADSEVEAHAGHVWVSEQELRESCAFFRHGESTARATLSILCTLKRLKQIPGRNMKITYICLTDD
jgi:hypothetical protein